MKTTSLPVPWGMSREIQGDRVVITRCWRKVDQIWGMIGATLIWNATMIGWYRTKDVDWFDGSGGREFFNSQLGQLVPLVFVGIGIFLVYASLASLANTTRLEVAASLLNVTTGPVPWHGERRIATTEVANVIYREKASKGYASIYRVMAVMADGKERRLVSGLLDYEATVFYVREIRAALSLPDVTLSPDA
jgi:hypothetical protein